MSVIGSGFGGMGFMRSCAVASGVSIVSAFAWKSWQYGDKSKRNNFYNDHWDQMEKSKHMNSLPAFWEVDGFKNFKTEFGEILGNNNLNNEAGVQATLTAIRSLRGRIEAAAEAAREAAKAAGEEVPKPPIQISPLSLDVVKASLEVGEYYKNVVDNPVTKETWKEGDHVSAKVMEEHIKGLEKEWIKKHNLNPGGGLSPEEFFEKASKLQAEGSEELMEEAVAAYNEWKETGQVPAGAAGKFTFAGDATDQSIHDLSMDDPRLAHIPESLRAELISRDRSPYGPE